MLVASPYEVDFRFMIADELRRRIITRWNVYSFFVTYAEIDGFDPAKDADPKLVGKSPNSLDRWMVSSLYQLVRDMGLPDTLLCNRHLRACARADHPLRE